MSVESRRQLRLSAVFALTNLFVFSCSVLVHITGCGSTPLDGGTPSPDQGSSQPDPIVDAANDPSTAVTGTRELSIEAKPVFCCNPLSITFSAATDQTVATPNSYEWDFGDGRIRRGDEVEHTFPWPGVYDVRVTARFPDGSFQTRTVQVTVGESAQPTLEDPDEVPANEGDDETIEIYVDAGPDAEAGAGEIVVLDGTRTKSSAPRTLRYEWKQVGGPEVVIKNGNAAKASFVAPPTLEDPLLLTFELTVKDAEVAGTDRTNVRVNPRPRPMLVAVAGPDQEVRTGYAVELDGSASRGVGSRELTFRWKQLSGPRVPLVRPGTETASFLAPQVTDGPVVLDFELKVTQGDLSATDTVRVSVLAEVGDDRSPPTKEQIFDWYSSLPPLPKVHYSWPIGTSVIASLDDDTLRHYIRVTHAITGWGEWVSQEYLDRFVRLCAEVNQTNPGLPASVALLFQPWEKIFPPDVPPTYRGPEHQEEIDHLTERLSTVRGWLERANRGRAKPVVLSAILFECERFEVKPETDVEAREWNEAIYQMHEASYQAAKAAFPNARVEWYNRGISELFTGREGGDSYSVNLYRVPNRAAQRTKFRTAYDAAKLVGVTNVTPWLSLGTAYIEKDDGTLAWSYENSYDVSFSWEAGAEINDPWYGDRAAQFAPWNAAEVVVFWPAPWDPSLPNWHRHFTAYVRGANNILDLP